MNLQIIRSDLHSISDLVTKWGLPDDGYRDEQLFNASQRQLQEIIDSLPQNKLASLTNWLVVNAENKSINMSDEYVNHTCYLMAYEMASILLQE